MTQAQGAACRTNIGGARLLCGEAQGARTREQPASARPYPACVPYVASRGVSGEQSEEPRDVRCNELLCGNLYAKGKFPRTGIYQFRHMVG